MVGLAQSDRAAGVGAIRIAVDPPLDGPARRVELGGVSPASSFWVDVAVGSDGAIAFTGSDPKRRAAVYYMASAAAAPKRLTDFNAEIAVLALGRTEVIEWQGTLQTRRFSAAPKRSPFGKPRPRRRADSSVSYVEVPRNPV